ncbi:MAG: DUF3999 family protein, partial [Gammaproteobacteria bacterium]
DLRVFNGHGEVVPYALERPYPQATVQRNGESLPLFTLRGDAVKALDAVRLRIQSGPTTINLEIPATNTQVTGGKTVGASAPVSTDAAGPVTSYIVDGRSLDLPIAFLQIAWPEDAADFAGRVQVEASDDLGAWRTVVLAAPIANLRAGEARLVERRVEMPPTQAKFWRLSWAGPAAPFEITNVIAEPARGRVDVERATLAVTGRPARDERPEAKPGETKPGEFEFDLGARMPVDRVNIELPEQNSVVELLLFSRAAPNDAWRMVTQSGFYRLRTVNGVVNTQPANLAPAAIGGEPGVPAVGGGAQPANVTPTLERNTDLTNGAISIEPNADRYWLARADARSAGMGRGAPQLRVGWLPHDIVFLARGDGPFTLAYGSGSAGSATASLGSIPSTVAITRAQLAEARTLGGESKLQRAPEPGEPISWQRVLLWAALAAGVALLAFMAYRLAKDLKN